MVRRLGTWVSFALVAGAIGACSQGTARPEDLDQPGEVTNPLCDKIDEVNPGLAAAIREQAQRTDREPITREELKELDNVRVEGLTTLAGFECLSKVWLLGLTRLKTSDLSPLAAMPRLQMLTIEGSAPPDLSTLRAEPDLARKSLVNITVLDSPISDLAPLEGMANLTALLLKGVGLESLDSLPAVPRLASVDLSRNPLSDLSPLSLLPELEMLVADETGVTTLNGLNGAPKLSSLSASSNRIETFDGLRLPMLTSLVVAQSEVAAWGDLSGVPRLEYADVAGNRLESLEGAETLTSLRTLYASDNPLASLAGAEQLTELSILTIANSSVSDLSPLASLPISNLDLVGTPVTDISMLARWAEGDGYCHRIDVPDGLDEASREVALSLCEAKWTVSPICQTPCKPLAL